MRKEIQEKLSEVLLENKDIFRSQNFSEVSILSFISSKFSNNYMLNYTNGLTVKYKNAIVEFFYNIHSLKTKAHGLYVYFPSTIPYYPISFSSILIKRIHNHKPIYQNNHYVVIIQSLLNAKKEIEILMGYVVPCVHDKKDIEIMENFLRVEYNNKNKNIAKLMKINAKELIKKHNNQIFYHNFQNKSIDDYNEGIGSTAKKIIIKFKKENR